MLPFKRFDNNIFKLCHDDISQHRSQWWAHGDTCLLLIQSYVNLRWWTNFYKSYHQKYICRRSCLQAFYKIAFLNWKTAMQLLLSKLTAQYSTTLLHLFYKEFAKCFRGFIFWIPLGQSFVILLSLSYPFMHNIEKWPNIHYKI